ncbi:MAG: hypothetical protein HRT88_00815 [Lentisphaeraceae bacterium]|nr:hypothetical protein [Lentisphaeraceae bacterium]
MSTNYYWGDLHNHNEVGYGAGKLERSFSIAQNSLDFYGFTPHGFWPDMPKNDHETRAYHIKGFTKTRDNWENVRELVRSYNKEDEFVTFLAYEWHSNKWGDYCVYFPDENGEICRAKDLDTLKEFALEKGCFILPHHVGYYQHCRSLNWAELDYRVSPVVEIFSEHGNSLEYYSHKTMMSHSMGGVSKQQTVCENLKSGLKIGFIADTDDHCGYPGNYGEGLTCILSDKLDRPSMIEALRSRHSYAGTGDRIEIDMVINDKFMMGDIIETNEIDFDINIKGQCPIKMVTLVKNSEPMKFWTPYTADTIKDDKSLVKLEWGWDRFDPGQTHAEVTKWTHKVKISGGEIHGLKPCLCGGDGSLVEENIYDWDAQSVNIKSYTSRGNIEATSGVVLEITNAPQAQISIITTAELEDGSKYELVQNIAAQELIDKDIHTPIYDCFAAPKLKVHSLIEAQQYQLKTNFSESVNSGDYYYLKVEQENGHMAWSSPVYIK